MSVRYHCDVCECERSEAYLHEVHLVIDGATKALIRQVCLPCRDQIESAINATVERLKPRNRVPITYHAKEKDEGF